MPLPIVSTTNYCTTTTTAAAIAAIRELLLHHEQNDYYFAKLTINNTYAPWEYCHTVDIWAMSLSRELK